jgi:hypothetical protein
MCLNSINPTFKRPAKTRIVTAYKFFKRAFNHYDINGKLDRTAIRFPMMGTYTPVTRDKWVRASHISRTNRPGRNQRYARGFHAFVSKKAAQAAQNYYFRGSEYRLLTVKLRGVHTKGKQYGVNCLVANELMVPSKQVKRAKTSAKRRASGKR